MLQQNDRRINIEAQQFALHAGCEAIIDKIRSAAFSPQGSSENGKRLITILDFCLLDDERRVVLASNPLNSFYQCAAAHSFDHNGKKPLSPQWFDNESHLKIHRRGWPTS